MSSVQFKVAQRQLAVFATVLVHIHITMSAAVALIVSSGHAAIANSQVVLVTHLVLQIAATVHNGMQHPSSSKFLHSVHAPLVNNVSRKLAHMHSAVKDIFKVCVVFPVVAA
jgi:hypothetical protein